MFSTTDTIVAIATPPGRGGLGVVRISGSEAHQIALALMGRREPLKPRHATFGRIVDRATRPASAGQPVSDGLPVDHVIVTHFVAPHSFTGEDVVEISGHGSPILLQRIVEMAIAAGARLAEPGEFTLRAHLAGKLDLPQAEAIADLVDAVTPLQARAAMDQLEGTLTSAIGEIEDALLSLTARLEASLDFPDEGFHFITRDETKEDLDRIGARLAALLDEGDVGRVIRDGSLVVLAGRPNVGKSSLFNALVGASRAIVTPVAGTTRDLLTERVDIGGVPVTLVDTAGLHDATEPVEVEGVARARQAQTVAQLTVVLVDGSQPLEEEDRQLVHTRGGMLIVVHKMDLPRAWEDDALGAPSGVPTVAVSSLTGDGLRELRQAMLAALTSRESLRDVPAISNVRHLGLVRNALAALDTAREVLQDGATEELVVAELSHARIALEELTGRTTPDELLHHIFSRFCVGK